MSKKKLYNGNISSTWTLHRIVRDILTIFSPICPFFTHYLSEQIYAISAIDIREFPRLDIDFSSEDYTNLTKPIMEFNSLVWKIKKESGISLNSELPDISIPDELMKISETLIQMHSLI